MVKYVNHREEHKCLPIWLHYCAQDSPALYKNVHPQVSISVTIEKPWSVVILCHWYIIPTAVNNPGRQLTKLKTIVTLYLCYSGHSRQWWVFLLCKLRTSKSGCLGSFGKFGTSLSYAVLWLGYWLFTLRYLGMRRGGKTGSIKTPRRRRSFLMDIMIPWIPAANFCSSGEHRAINTWKHNSLDLITGLTSAVNIITSPLVCVLYGEAACGKWWQERGLFQHYISNSVFSKNRKENVFMSPVSIWYWVNHSLLNLPL